MIWCGKSNQDTHGRYDNSTVTAICEFRFVTILVHKFTGFSSVYNLSDRCTLDQINFATISFPQVKMDMQTNVGT
jgi:hypothetical protein